MNQHSISEVLEANIRFHTALAETYDTEQPHYRPENKGLVSQRLAKLAATAGKNNLIDLGCGTGFVIHLAVPYFTEIIGVDITPAMMAKVDQTSGKVKLLQVSTENIPLADNYADVITANSFLHHLYDIRPTITEAYRLLKKGGVFFSEEDPNIYFWEAIKNLALSNERSDGISDEREEDSYSGIIKRELSAVLKVHTEISSVKDVEPHIVQLAEYQKMVLGGMSPTATKALFYEVGFSKVNIEYYWFLGQGQVMHSTSSEDAAKIEMFLRSVLPLSQHLFKYFRVEAWK